MGDDDVIGRRIGAAVIDFVIAILLLFVVGALFGNASAKDSAVSAHLGPLDTLLYLALLFVYFAATEAAWGATIGKRVVGLHVIAADGSKPSTTAILIRNVVRFVDWIPGLYIIGAITLFAGGQPRRRLGDRAAKTRVVAAGAPPPQAGSPPPSRPPDEDVLAQIMR
jgi:uncharacterized RDD family membrane protein YckC